MEIIDLSEEHEKTYFCCLEDWSEDLAEAGDHKEHWYRSAVNEGLRVKLAKEDDGKIVGMIQYLPIESSYVDGRDLYFIACIWVHGYKEGVGDNRGHGIGTALLEAAEDDARNLGASGMAAWGLVIPAFMRAAWFKKHGYARADRDGVAMLLWKPFADSSVAPAWRKEKRKPTATPGQVTVSAFKFGWCPAQNLAYERARRAAIETADKTGKAVVFDDYDTHDPAVFEEWGIADALYIDGKSVRTGPPPSYEKIKKKIEKRVKRL